MRLPLYALLCATACAVPALGQTSPSDGTNVALGNPLALTFYIAPQHPAEAEAKARSIQTPGSSDYRHFLTLSQFVKDYAVSDKDISSIESSLETLGFTISYVFPNHLGIQVLGTVEAAQNALSVKLTHVTRNGKSGFAPTAPITLPTQLQGLVRAVGGLNTVATARPMKKLSALNHGATKLSVPEVIAGGTPGNYLPADFEKFYNVSPLYQQGLSGSGKTIGIVTLNTFKPADAYTFWEAIGLKVSQSRITTVDVDGGTTAASNNADGEGETDLDTEYSGAIAPGADLRVYVAPNDTNNGFLDAFEFAASENIVDTLSTSWGEPELFYFASTNPTTASDTGMLDSFHDAFLEMALQGQTVYVAAGDSGSFDTVRDCPAFGTPSAKNVVCNAPYAVDAPANDPLVTAAGGTTLPFTAKLSDGFVISVPKERAWGWDYIVSEAAAQGFGSVFPLSEFFSTGGGGGVSSYFRKPWYQDGVTGIEKTQPGQYFAEDFGQGSLVEVTLPAKFAGRNMPDLSTNADPESGYQYVEEGSLYDFYGGTSFVAPQLNGVTALLAQGLGSRVGQINPALYQLGSAATTKLNAGDNWGYSAVPGYDNASGIGTLDATKLLKGLKNIE